MKSDLALLVTQRSKMSAADTRRRDWLEHGLLVSECACGASASWVPQRFLLARGSCAQCGQRMTVTKHVWGGRVLPYDDPWKE